MRRIRYSRLRRISMYRGYNRRPLPRGQRVVMSLLILILIMFAALSIVLIQLRPIILKLGTAKANAAVLLAVNNVIDAEINNGTFDYSKLIKMDKDASGNVAALETNMALVNSLKARLTKEILNSVEIEMVNDMRIPIGNAIGGILFSGRGPSFIVKILSVQSVHTAFLNDFSDAGVNQTRHKIMLEISVDITVFVPGTKTIPTTVTTQVEVCETVIVGKVPNVYADFGDSTP
jgi:sporulation protein YunB